MYVERKGLSIGGKGSEPSVVWSVGGLWSERISARNLSTLHPAQISISTLTGLSGGEVKVGVGSMVDNADAPVSPLSSPPRLLDFRLGLGFRAVDMIWVYSNSTSAHLWFQNVRIAKR